MKIRGFVLFCLITLNFSIGYSQKFFEVVYKDTLYMSQSSTGIWNFNEGITDGIYFAYSDSLKFNLLIQGNIKNGKLNGFLIYYPTKQDSILTIVEYKEGKRNGLYLDTYQTEGRVLSNIYLWKNDVEIKVIKKEW